MSIVLLGLEFTPSTVVVALIIAALAFLAVRRMWRSGLCDCRKDEGSCAGGCAGCAGCAAADRMAADMQKAARTRS